MTWTIDGSAPSAAAAAALRAVLGMPTLYRGTFASRPGSPAVGDEAIFTDGCFAPAGCHCIWTGSAWWPLGDQVLWRATGSYASPAAAVTGVGSMTGSGLSGSIPGGFLKPGMQLGMDAAGKRSTGTTASTIEVSIGGVVVCSLNLSSNKSYALRSEMQVTSSGIATASWTGDNAASASLLVGDKVIDLSVDTAVSWAITVGDASDVHNIAFGVIVVR